MKRGPIGVWFSVVLLILVAGTWVGSKLGEKLAAYWFRYQQKQQEQKYGAERVHLDQILSRATPIETLRLFTFSIPDAKQPNDELLFKNIEALKYMSRNPGVPELKPVIDLDLGLAEVKAATIDEQNNKTELASNYMKSAQSLFQSLGWQDVSEASLKNVEQSELELPKLPTQAKGSPK